MREVINWPIRVWLLALSLNVAISLAIGVALTDFQLLIFFMSTCLLTALFAWRNRLILEVDQSGLRVGDAYLERKYVGEIIELDEAKMKSEQSSLLNPRAFLGIRFWVKGGIKVIINDPRDPTPYWLISSRKANQIKELLEG